MQLAEPTPVEIPLEEVAKIEQRQTTVPPLLKAAAIGGAGYGVAAILAAALGAAFAVWFFGIIFGGGG